MLISCISCNSKYLVNSADLKPNGRNVKCSKCEHQWYQDCLIDDILDNSSISDLEIPILEENINKKMAQEISNLPSTYVKEQKVSLINSFLVILAVILLFTGFIFLRNININSFVIIQYYFNEFIFNFQLIINDITSIIYKLIYLIKAN